MDYYRHRGSFYLGLGIGSSVFISNPHDQFDHDTGVVRSFGIKRGESCQNHVFSNISIVFVLERSIRS